MPRRLCGRAEHDFEDQCNTDKTFAGAVGTTPRTASQLRRQTATRDADSRISVAHLASFWRAPRTHILTFNVDPRGSRRIGARNPRLPGASVDQRSSDGQRTRGNQSDLQHPRLSWLILL